MRDELYADKKDVIKWSLAINSAGSDRRILYIAMLRPALGEHGCDTRVVHDANRMVADFFHGERAAIQNGAKREVARIGALNSCIQPILEGYSKAIREPYFKKVIRLLKDRPPECGYLVLIDPDDGIGGNRPSSKHLCRIDISNIWPILRAGDILMIYQTPWRKKKGVRGVRRFSEPCEILARTIGVDSSAIKLDHRGDVGFFTVEKD